MHGLHLNLHIPMITYCNSSSNPGWSWPPDSGNGIFNKHLQTCSIMASKSISEFTRSWPPNASANWLDQGLQVQSCFFLFIILRCNMKCFQAPPAASRDMQSVDWQLYWSLDIVMHRWEYKLNQLVVKSIEWYLAAIISRCTSSIPKQDVTFHSLLYSDSSVS
jgi:hypothetical protein